MYKKSLLLLFCFLAACISIIAHEFWIEPSRTKVKVGEAISLGLQVGEQFTGERWEGKGNRIIKYKHYYNGGAFDLLNSIRPDSVTRLLDFTPVFEGTHLLAIATNYSYIELEPEKFEAYLVEDGLKNALAYRRQHDEEGKIGRERYRRCAKLLIQAGDKTDKTYGMPSGLAMDIIPFQNAYDLKKETSLKFKVNYEGKPLPYAMVRCWYKNGPASLMDIQYSSKKGDVAFERKGAGTYMISVVHMERIENDSKADWQSTWGSLVFGI